MALSADALADKLKQNPYNEEDQFQTHASVTLLAIELDLESGKILRRLYLFERDDPAPIHAANSYASPTPTTDGQRLYCHFGSLGTVAVSIDSGKILWARQYVVDDITGPGGSPVLCDDHLILVHDGADKQFVVALDKRTGREVWRQDRPPVDSPESKHRRGFSTPLLIEHQGRQQLIAPTAQWVVAYDPSSGDELWKVNFATGHAVIPRPVYSNGRVYVCSSYKNPELFAIRVDGSGDVTDTHVLWKYSKQVPQISSPLVCASGLYFVSNMGVVTCLDAETGTRLWHQRIAGNYSASPILAEEKLYFLSEEGITTVLRPGREFQLLAQNQLFGQTMASIAVAGQSLLIRTDPYLYCLRKSELEITKSRDHRP
jgi:hypothetical protein